MPKQGKRYTTNATKVEPKTYGLSEAITLLQSFEKAKFDESIEIHLRLGIDPKQGEQQVRGTVVLPHGAGRIKRVAVFAEGEAEIKAKEKGLNLEM